MSRLAIVISAVSGVESLETTLVSVLENRPPGSEVIVVANFAYDDPYDLAGEVQIMAAPVRTDFVGCANLGIGATQAPLVHVLAAGCTVTDGWADAAVKHFDDPRVAAVAPLVLDAARRNRVLAAGMVYGAGGVRRQSKPGLQRAEAAGARQVFGACGFASFFRKSALAAVGGCTSQVGPTMADVELACSLRRAGYRAICEPASHVYSPRTPLPREAAFGQGFCAERIFWRNAGSMGWKKSLALHPWVVAVDTLAHLMNPAVVLRLAGRLWACCQIGEYVRHYHELTHNMEPADVVPIEPAAGRLRVDGSHAGTREPRSKRIRSASGSERREIASRADSPPAQPRRRRHSPAAHLCKRTCHAKCAHARRLRSR